MLLKLRLKDESGRAGEEEEPSRWMEQYMQRLLSAGLLGSSGPSLFLWVSSAETLNIFVFPWNLFLGREGGNQAPQIKLCDINNPLPRPLGLGVAGSLGCC